MNPVGIFQFSVFFVDSPTALPAERSAAGGALRKLTPNLQVRCAEVQGIDAGVEVETYHEGGRNAHPLRFARWGRFGNLVFRRGVTDDTALWDWFGQVQNNSLRPLRKNGFVLLQSPVANLSIPGLVGQPIAGWFFTHALPEKLSGPGLHARGNEIAVEALEVAHEGLMRLETRNIPGLSSFLSKSGGAR